MSKRASYTYEQRTMTLPEVAAFWGVTEDEVMWRFYRGVEPMPRNVNGVLYWDLIVPVKQSVETPAQTRRPRNTRKRAGVAQDESSALSEAASTVDGAAIRGEGEMQDAVEAEDVSGDEDSE